MAHHAGDGGGRVEGRRGIGKGRGGMAYIWGVVTCGGVGGVGDDGGEVHHAEGAM